MKYPYINKDVITNKISYSYSKFEGKKFIRSWRVSRESYLKRLPKAKSVRLESILFSSSKDNLQKCQSGRMLDSWIDDIFKNRFDFYKINILLKRFEVTKKLYAEYDKNFRPSNKDNYRNTTIYIKFGCVLSLAYQATHKMQYLNAILKLNDMHCNSIDDISLKDREIMHWLLYKEQEFIASLCKKRKLAAE